MARQWTEEQLKAIEARDTNLLVSAAAGSGKTALLIERISRLILDEGVDVSEILVMTFTRAAAAEMKERLKVRLTEALSESHRDTGRILDQLHRMGTAGISTLDAFCTSFLRENFQTADIDPDFSMGNEGELKNLHGEVMEDVLERFYLTVPEDELNGFGRFVGMFSDYRSDEKIRQLITRFHRFLSTLPDPEGWCEKALQDFDLSTVRSGETDFFEARWGKSIRAENKKTLEAALKLLDEGLKLCDTDGVFEKISQLLWDEKEQIKGLQDSLDLGAEEFYSRLGSVNFGRFNTPRKLDEFLTATKESIKDLRTEAQDLIKDLKNEGNYEAILSTIEEMAESMGVLVEVTQAFSQAFFERKQEEGLLDFADAERLTLKVLQENPSLSDALRQRYAYVFIDEFQDTNAMQEAIIQCFVRPDNYFMVGDVKQSIYRFRLADPGIFIEKYHRYKKRNDNDSNTLVTLSKNFRSAPSVINSVNGIFEKIMTEVLGEVNYDEDARLYPGLPFLKTEDRSHQTEIHIISGYGSSESEGNPAAVSEAGLSDTEREARHMAGMILDMVGKPFTDPRTGEEKILRYGDIGILMRAVSGRSSVIKKVFKDAGIPLYFDGGEAYYETLEITLMLNLLRLIDNRCQDMPLLSVILSPIGDFSTEDCARIRGADREAPYFHQSFWSYLEGCEENDPIAQKVKALNEQLDRWRWELRFMDIEAFLWKVYRDTGYYTFVGGLKGGEQRQSNLRQLIKKAAAYKRATMKGIFHFVRFVDQMKQQNVDDLPPGILDENDDVVRLMTIHKSKGLEFPIVFVAGLGRQFNREGSGRILFHKDLGICPQCIRFEARQMVPTAPYNLCKQRMKRESLSEEMRLLYVAMTRAEDQLYLIGSVKDGTLEKRQTFWQKEPDPYQLEKASCLLDWVMMAVKENDPHFVIKTIDKTFCEYENVFAMDQVIESEAKTDFIADLEWHYPYETAEKIPEKITVTQLKALAAGENADAFHLPEWSPRPAFMQGEDRQNFSAAELGTAVHALLSGVDLRGLRGCYELLPLIESHADAMVASQKVLPALREALDLKPVADFFSSSLGQRLLAAEIVWREKPFNYHVKANRFFMSIDNEDRTITIQGMIDCCFMEEDAWVLLDYKTDRYNNASERDTLAKHYSIQLNLYAEALECLTGYTVKEKYLVLLHGNEAVRL